MALACASGLALAETGRAERIEAKARQILAGPAFRYANKTTATEELGRKVQKGLEWVFEKLGKLVPQPKPLHVGNSDWLLWVLCPLLIVLLAFVFAYAVRRFAAGAEERKESRQGVAEILESDDAASTDADEWLEAARELARSGDYRRAYRAVFVALLLRLDRAGILRYERSRTNGEYLRGLRKQTALLEVVQPFANAFDARWYGHLPATEADFEAGVGWYQKALDLLKGGTGAS